MLSIDALLSQAVEALHCLNRRAKEKRDRANEYRRARFATKIREELDQIYALKDRFIAAALRAGLATAARFEVRVPGSMVFHCCGREWYGAPDCDVSICYRCDNDVYGEPEDDDITTWYLVTVLGYRFHQPHLAPDLAELAVPCEPHDPTQPQREIPDCGLTIAAQQACVALAAERLEARLTQPASVEPVAPIQHPEQRSQDVGGRSLPT